MVNRHEHQTTELHQTHSGDGDNVGRDKITNNYLCRSVDYQQIIADIKDEEELLAAIATDRIELRLKHSAKLNALTKRLKDFTAEVFRLHELFNRTPINTERLRLAKAHFDRGEFREADAVLKTEEINAEVVQLKARKAAALETVAAMDNDLADLANKFVLKAWLSLVNPTAEGESRFKRTEQYFEQALAAARTVEVLFEYARFLHKHNAFRQAEPFYQEALKQCRSQAAANPEAFLPNLATTLNNLAILHKAQNAFDPALAAYEEALTSYRSLAVTNPEAFLPYVATTLNNLANLHYAQNAFGPALAAYEKALQIRRSLAAANPKAFLPAVAMTLISLAFLHWATKAFIPALAAYREALKLYRSLVKANPEAFLPNVAQTLNNMAVLHEEINAFTPALAGYEEALQLYRSLAETNPEAFLPDVAMTLVNLSILHFDDVPDQKPSIAYAQEAHSILIPLCAKMPHLQWHLDMAKRLLEANAATPAA